MSMAAILAIRPVPFEQIFSINHCQEAAYETWLNLAQQSPRSLKMLINIKS